jgi:hypothetical protein
VDNNEVDLREMEWYGLALSGSGYELMEGSYGHGSETLDSIKCWNLGGCTVAGLSRKSQLQGFSLMRVNR